MAESVDTNKPLAVMFAAIAEPARLYEKHGNTPGWGLVSECLSAMATISRAQRGRVIKTVGEEIICVFDDVARAALAANEIQEAVRRCGAESELAEPYLSARIGIHFGPVIDEGDDIFGDTVNSSARLMGLAKSAQILVSEELVVALPLMFRNTARFVDDVPLRGKSVVIRVFELVWEVSESTTTTGVTSDQLRVDQERCVVEHQGAEWRLQGPQTTLRIGRANDADVRCNGAPVSREHARIELHRGRFMLTDQSVNGTYVQPDGEPLLKLRREQFNLQGTGVIGVGQVPGEDPELTLRYRCS